MQQAHPAVRYVVVPLDVEQNTCKQKEREDINVVSGPNNIATIAGVERVSCSVFDTRCIYFWLRGLLVAFDYCRT